MTLIDAILKKVQTKDEVMKYPSPPPEIDETILKKKGNKRVDKFAHVRPIVDTSPPLYDAGRLFRDLPEWTHRTNQLYFENVQLICAIAKAHKCGIPRVVPTACLEKEWRRNKQEIVRRACRQFLLFPMSRTELMEDQAFACPHGVARPRVYMKLRMRNASHLGTLEAELFTDVCPATCRLFLELLDGDGLGHGYVGTRFFRKVPYLFWSGGDVIYDNGFGCYAQKGRVRPILAENYHFSHSIPGLLSMRTTKDEEMCGIFNITFKPLPQFDLKNVVFGRIIRPCPAFDVITTLGSPFSAYPVIEIVAAGRRAHRHCHTGQRLVTRGTGSDQRQ